MKVLLTGGRGMLGRNLQDHSLAAAHEIVAPASSALDLTDRAASMRYLADCRPDVVVHCAGKVGGIQAKIVDPVGFLTQNVDMGMNVVLAAQAAGVPRVLNLGSSSMYPRAAQSPLREDMVLNGSLDTIDEGYALAKIVVARLCDYISRTTPHFRYRTLIPCNVFGPHDKFDPKVSHLVPAIIHKIHSALQTGSDTVEIWGNGTARRECILAGDLAEGIWTAINRFDDLPEMMNMGVGTDHSINDYYETTARVIGWQGRFVHDLSKPTGMKQRLVCVHRQREFGWMPATSLEDSIAQTYAYFLSTLN